MEEYKFYDILIINNYPCIIQIVPSANLFRDVPT